MAIGDPTSPLTPKQEEAIAALIAYPTIKQAAQAVGVGERTLHRWLVEDQPFIAAYGQARRVTFAQAVAQSQRLLPLALNTLGQIMADKSVPASSRVSAATAVTKFSRESMELDELAERVRTLERQIGGAAAVGGTSR
jgi:hypothetical protein